MACCALRACTKKAKNVSRALNTKSTGLPARFSAILQYSAAKRGSSLTTLLMRSAMTSLVVRKNSKALSWRQPCCSYSMSLSTQGWVWWVSRLSTTRQLWQMYLSRLLLQFLYFSAWLVTMVRQTASTACLSTTKHCLMVYLLFQAILICPSCVSALPVTNSMYRWVLAKNSAWFSLKAIFIFFSRVDICLQAYRSNSPWMFTIFSSCMLCSGLLADTELGCWVLRDLDLSLTGMDLSLLGMDLSLMGMGRCYTDQQSTFYLYFYRLVNISALQYTYSSALESAGLAKVLISPGTLRDELLLVIVARLVIGASRVTY